MCPPSESSILNQEPHDRQEGGRLNAYSHAFGVVGAGVALVAVFVVVVRRVRSSWHVRWQVRRWQMYRQVRRFQRALADIDFIVVDWRDSLQNRPATDEVPDPLPDFRRPWREWYRKRDRGAEPLT
jgi:hypothetical protein